MWRRDGAGGRRASGGRTFVGDAVKHGWVGIEALAGIPGSVGATPIQNVGAYGQEVSQTIASVRVWDRKLRGIRTFANADCGFGYRTSRFKADPGRHVVLEVTFQFRQGTSALRCGTPSWRRGWASYRAIGRPSRTFARPSWPCGPGRGWSSTPTTTTPGARVRSSPTRCSPRRSPRVCPRTRRAGRNRTAPLKTSAAWLIEHAGFTKGYGNDRVSLSTKHTLAVTNRGQASTADLIALAREVRDGVEQKFGVRLVNEPVLVGCSLD